MITFTSVPDPYCSGTDPISDPDPQNRTRRLQIRNRTIDYRSGIVVCFFLQWISRYQKVQISPYIFKLL
jgi:hypothetical protein